MRCRPARPWGRCSWDLISSIWWRINRTQFLALVKGQHHKYFLSPAPFILHFCYLLLFGSNGPRLVRSHTLSFYSQNLILPMITLEPITPRTWSYNTVSFSGSITTSHPSYHHLLHFRTSQEVRLRVSISCLLACNSRILYCLISSWVYALYRFHTSRSICRSCGALLCMWRRM